MPDVGRPGEVPVKKLSLVLALAMGGCAYHSTASARAVRITDQGGLIRMEGETLEEAAQAAVRTMKRECGDTFTVKAIEDNGSPSWTSGHGLGDAGVRGVPAVWRDLSYDCGGQGQASPLTKRVLEWAAKADAEDAAREAERQAMQRAYPCGDYGQCDNGGTCFAGLCR
jgi:hypothetical protein